MLEFDSCTGREAVNMPITIRFDKSAPTASVELMLNSPAGGFASKEIEAPTPREIEKVLVSEKFRELTHEAHAVVERELTESKLEIVQLAGTICHDVSAYRPGIQLVVREHGRSGEMSETARERLTSLAEALREALNIP
jgi:hypothetical protein